MKHLWFKKVVIIAMPPMLLVTIAACGSSEGTQNNGHDMEQEWSVGNDHDTTPENQGTNDSDVYYEPPQTDEGNDIPEEQLESNPGPVQKDAIAGEWEHESGELIYYFYLDDHYNVTDSYDTYYGSYTYNGYTLTVDDGSGIVEHGYFDFSEGGHLYLENTKGKFYYNGKGNSDSFNQSAPPVEDFAQEDFYIDNDAEQPPHVMIQKDAIVGEWEHESGDFNYYLYEEDRYEVREGEDIFCGTYSFDGEVILLDDGSGFPVNGTFDFSDGGHLYIDGAMGRFYFNGR